MLFSQRESSASMMRCWGSCIAPLIMKQGLRCEAGAGMKAGAILVILANGVFAQSASVRPEFREFEVATIKPTPPGASGRWIRMLSANEFAAKNHALRTLIAAAYNVSPQAVLGGSGWVDAEHFDITARTPGAVRPNLDEQMSMLRSLLTDRFQLAFHRE